MEYLKQMADVDLVAIPYSGSGAVLPDFLAGHVTLFFDALVTPQVKAGKAIGLGIASATRDPDLPDLPTIDEAAKAAGLPGFILSSWQGAWFPKDTSPEIVEKMASAIATVGARPDVQRRLKLGSMVAWTTSPAEMEAQMRKDFETYGKLIASVGIKQE